MTASEEVKKKATEYAKSLPGSGVFPATNTAYFAFIAGYQQAMEDMKEQERIKQEKRKRAHDKLALVKSYWR